MKCAPRWRCPRTIVRMAWGHLRLALAGLSHVLNVLGAATSASCRGHFGPTAWARLPVVYFAAERPWAELIRDLVVAGGSCGLDVIEEGLLIIWAPTVVGTSELAGQLWDARQDFASIGVSAVRSWAEGAR